MKGESRIHVVKKLLVRHREEIKLNLVKDGEKEEVIGKYRTKEDVV